MSMTPFKVRYRDTGTEETAAVQAVRAIYLHRMVEVGVTEEEMIVHLLV